MKKIEYLLFLIFLVSCNKNREYLTQIKERINSDGAGFDMKYKSVEFRFKDTIFISNFKDSVLIPIHRLSAKLAKDSDFIYDGNTPKRILQLQKRIIEREQFTKSILGYDQKNPILSQLYKRLDSARINFNILNKPFETWVLITEYKANHAFYLSEIDLGKAYLDISSEISRNEKLSFKIDSLSKYPDNKPVFFRAYNKYTIKNPFFSGAKQTLESIFVFDENNKLIDRIDENNFDLKTILK